jgi:hypothetical protein
MIAINIQYPETSIQYLASIKFRSYFMATYGYTPKTLVSIWMSPSNALIQGANQHSHMTFFCLGDG